MSQSIALRSRSPRRSAAGLVRVVLCMTAMPALLPAVSVGLFAAPASAQSAEPQLRFASVTADDVYFRSGPADTYYPMGRLQRGDVLAVLDERFGWTRVQMRGPAFREFFAHIRSPRGEGARFERLAGNRGRTIGRVDLLAPNLNTRFRPADSWKRLRLLDNNTELEILDVTSTDEDDYFHVVIPPTTEGWISSSFLTTTTRQEFDAYVARHTADAVRESTERPAAPPLARETPRLDPADAQPEVRREAEPAARPGREETPVTPPAARPTENRTERESQTTERAADRPEETAARTAAPAQPAPAEAEDAPRTAFDDLEVLEAAFRKIQNQPIEDAEVIPLRDLYQALITTHTDNAAVRGFAERRVEQLTLWNRLQERRQRLATLERRLDVTTEDVQAARTAMETTGSYLAVGRLVSSTIFEGERLPRLFRLQDPTSGRTLAYIRPDGAFDLNSMIGQMIGVTGDRTFDQGLRIDLIRPRRIDLLVPGR